MRVRHCARPGRMLRWGPGRMLRPVVRPARTHIALGPGGDDAAPARAAAAKKPWRAGMPPSTLGRTAAVRTARVSRVA